MNYTKFELLLLGLIATFASIWVLIITPNLEQSSYFYNLNPIFQYLLFNTGFILLSIIIINVPYKLIADEEFDFLINLKLGISGWLIFSFIFDLWQPPNYLSPLGQILIPAQAALPNTAVDAMVTYVWSSIISPNIFVNGISLLYIFVYFVTPIIAVISMIMLLKPSLVIKTLLQR